MATHPVLCTSRCVGFAATQLLSASRFVCAHNCISSYHVAVQQSPGAYTNGQYYGGYAAGANVSHLMYGICSACTFNRPGAYLHAGHSTSSNR